MRATVRLACGGIVGLVTIGASSVAVADPIVLRAESLSSAPAPGSSPVAPGCRFPAQVTLHGGTALAATQASLTIVQWDNTVDPQAIAAASSVHETMESSTTPYLSWMQSEYGIPPVTIGGNIVLTPAIVDPDLSDAQIRTALLGQAQTPPGTPPSATTLLYLVHLPPGVSVVLPVEGVSCVDYCAYHDSFTVGAQSVYYAVIPDFATTGCRNVCGEDATGTWQRSLQMVESHEIIGMLTDPNGAGWTDFGQPALCGPEIGDICDLEPAEIDGWGGPVEVQKMWSNLAAACVTGNATPEIDSISPTIGPTSGGEMVTITGARFSTSSGATSFAFSPGNFATQVHCSSTTACTAVTPPFLETSRPTSQVPVTAAVNGLQSSWNGSQDSYTYRCPQLRSCPAGACGVVSDGCGGTRDCGSCPSGRVCLGQTCCAPLTPAQACNGKTCGTASDGCGGGVSCGTSCCTMAQACGSKTCGTVSDGCGGQLSCGFCPAGTNCNTGTCAPSCPRGQVFCDGRCTRPTSCQ